MLTLTSEFLFGVFIGFVLGLLLNGIICNDRLNTGALIQSTKLKSITKLSAANKIYSPEIEKLWNDLKRLYDERIKLDPKFSFSKMAFEIRKLLGEQKAIATSTIRNFYLRRTTPREKTIEAIQHWIHKEKENVNHEDDEIIGGSDNNSDSKGDNEI